MGFLSNLFGKKEAEITTPADFWNWFASNSASFLKVLEVQSDIAPKFLDLVVPNLQKLRDDLYVLAGKPDESTGEMIITTDGTVAGFAFVEDLVASAPPIANWIFTAHKPAHGKDFGIEMNGLRFDSENLYFAPVDDLRFPDEIDLLVAHESLTEGNREAVTHGIYLFLDNFLGELEFVTKIDNLTVVPKSDIRNPRPLAELPGYLALREKDFVEKYDAVRHDTENDEYALMEFPKAEGGVIVAMMNTTLLQWDAAPSHPWIAAIDLAFSSDLPDNATAAVLESIEDEITAELKDSDGYLNIGRITGGGTRTIYIACRDFRRPSRVIDRIKQLHAPRVPIEFRIFKDKYWRIFDNFRDA